MKLLMLVRGFLVRFCVCPLLVTLPCGIAAAQSTTPSQPAPTRAGYLDEAAHGITALQGWYTESTGLYRTTGWWNAANAVTVLADDSRLAHTNDYLPVFQNTLRQAQGKYAHFLNDYYDDEGWWALAWIDVYDLTHDAAYLAQADSIFTDMTGGWDATCGGGIWWSKERTYKNAIANELFLSVAAQLAVRSQGAKRAAYLDWAQRDWTWFQGTGMINGENLINDGLVTATCKNNGRTMWSYNQGVILGGLTAMNSVAPSAALLTQATTIADAVIAHQTDGSEVLHDPCEPDCGDDGVQFKGVFLRNLAALQAATPKDSYRQFAEANAQSIWQHAQGPHYQLDQVWSGPFRMGNAAIQTSALDAMLAAASMSR